MVDRFNKAGKEQLPLECDPAVPAAAAKRPYEAPRSQKKRSIHRITLISGQGPTSVSAVSMTN